MTQLNNAKKSKAASLLNQKKKSECYRRKRGGRVNQLNSMSFFPSLQIFVPPHTHPHNLITQGKAAKESSGTKKCFSQYKKNNKSSWNQYFLSRQTSEHEHTFTKIVSEDASLWENFWFHIKNWVYNTHSHAHTHTNSMMKGWDNHYTYFIISNIQNTQGNTDSCSDNVTTDTVLSFWEKRLCHTTHFNHNYGTSRDTIQKCLHPLIKKILIDENPGLFPLEYNWT